MTTIPSGSSTRILWPWLLLAIVLRTVSASTHTAWFHPDEWFQTFEFAEVWRNGVAMWSQELGLHLRNQTYPLLLAGAMSVADWISPANPEARVFAGQWLTGLIDLLGVWGFAQVVLKAAREYRWPMSRVHWAMALFLLPWFRIHEGKLTSAEHLSEVLFWVALGCWARGYALRFGIALVAIATARYPSGLLSLGLFIAATVQWSRSQQPQEFGRAVMGGVIALFIFGGGDALLYGRPWESLYTYTMYNVLTGLSAKVFGTQSAAVYLEFFRWRWARYAVLAPLGITLLGLALPRIARGVRRWEPASWAFFLYAVGHLLIGHKEYRFLVPIHSLWMWMGWVAACELWDGWGKRAFQQSQWLSRPRVQQAMWVTGVVVLGLNGLFALKEIWGMTWTPGNTYFEVARHLKEERERGRAVCGVVTPKFPNSLLLPEVKKERDSTRATGWRVKPVPAWGQTIFPRNRSGMAHWRTETVGWLEAQPECEPGARLLVHVQRPEPAWGELGCDLLASGVLRFIPRSSWSWASEKGWVSGSWYSCPAAETLALSRPGQVTRALVALPPGRYPLGHFEELPSLGTSGPALAQLGRKNVEPADPVGSAYFFPEEK